MALLGAPAAGAAQGTAGATAGEWNGPTVLELVSRARETRQQAVQDTTFRSYEALAQGFVYFFLDRPDEEDHTLVKADQVALEVYWRAPNDTKQRIVGHRDEKVLPTDIRYHLDHLTVVQDDFDDRIRLGDGDEVQDVLHPIAPSAPALYDYLLADSLTIAFPGTPDSVRVYEVQVKPQNFDLPGLVGSVFLDRETAAIVRMRFTFTPTSYVDPYLDWIRISLENARWLGRYWLPYRQEVEIRRELPQLDFLAGSVIRGRFEIAGYEFNRELPDALFRTTGVSAAPEEQRRAFEFEEPLFSQLEEEGLGTSPTMEEVRATVAQLAGDRYLSGLRRLRLHVPDVSHAYRYNRAEGHLLGAGTTYRPGSRLVLQAWGGYATGRDRPAARLRVAPATGGRHAVAYWNALRDVGPFPGAPGALNSLSGLVLGEDYSDPYFASGVRLQSAAAPFIFGSRFTAALAWERHVSAGSVVDEPSFRAVRPVAEGDRLSFTYLLEWGQGLRPTDGWGAAVSVEGPLIPQWDAMELDYDMVHAVLAWSRSDTWRDLDVEWILDAGAAGGSAPQRLFLMGGRETLLGHPYRHFVGDRFWLLRAQGSRAVAEPWISLRLFGAAGQASLDGPLPEGWFGDLDAGVKGSLGIGAGLLWDVIHLDLGYGLGSGGDWSFALGIAPRFHPWL